MDDDERNSLSGVTLVIRATAVDLVGSLGEGAGTKQSGLETIRSRAQSPVRARVGGWGGQSEVLCDGV